jgi:hypothetical protein
MCYLQHFEKIKNFASVHVIFSLCDKENLWQCNKTFPRPIHCTWLAWLTFYVIQLSNSLLLHSQILRNNTLIPLVRQRKKKHNKIIIAKKLKPRLNHNNNKIHTIDTLIYVETQYGKNHKERIINILIIQGRITTTNTRIQPSSPLYAHTVLHKIVSC